MELIFTPYSWAKFIYMRDKTSNEVGAMGICDKDNPLKVLDLAIVKQDVTSVTTKLDSDALADCFDQQLVKGLQYYQFARVWLHTHPGNGATPSGTDEGTFKEVFGDCDWAIMGILAKGGATSCRFKAKVSQLAVPITQEIQMKIDYSCSFPAGDVELWKTEYETNVKSAIVQTVWEPSGHYAIGFGQQGYTAQNQYDFDSKKYEHIVKPNKNKKPNKNYDFFDDFNKEKARKQTKSNGFDDWYPLDIELEQLSWDRREQILVKHNIDHNKISDYVCKRNASDELEIREDVYGAMAFYYDAM